ncbi:MAG: hypothetical protein J2P15_13380 [Micromonosporaceae bacterium]|nr:hypothetical protein [Micromonosporaceae bacterium]
MSGASGKGGETAVDPVALDKAVGQLNRASHDFGALRKGYQGTARDAPTAFGEFGVHDSWSAFDHAWDAELRKTGEALSELIQQIRAASAGLQNRDVGSGRSIRAVTPR